MCFALFIVQNFLFLNKPSFYREKLCSEACKNMPELLLRGHHFLKDVEYHKCRMDDVRKTG